MAKPTVPEENRNEGADFVRDHLFISYAWEDSALTDWLVRKLTALGYKVWCDRFRMLGGERWPKDIDKAIKIRTFRMIALLSHYSVDKENPSKERQIALTLSKAWKEDFLIPLNVDGLKAEEIGWELSDLTWIRFENWATGLAQLVELLEKIEAPRPLTDNGAAIAIDSFSPAKVVTEGPERVLSNCLRVIEIPEVLHLYRPTREVANLEHREMWRRWPAYKLSPECFASFWQPPPDLLAACSFSRTRSLTWKDSAKIEDVNARHIIKNLLRQSVLLRCAQRGLKTESDGRTSYFSAGLVPKNKIAHQSYTGRKVSLATIGERKFGKGRLRYHLGVGFWFRDDVLADPVVEIKVRLHITDPASPDLGPKAANAMRKKVAKSWWNHEWLSRQLAITEFLAEGGSEIAISPSGDSPVRIETRPVEAQVSPGINDKELARLKKRVRAMNAAEPDSEADWVNSGQTQEDDD